MLDLSRLPNAIRSEGGISRRLFLAYGSALAALPLLDIRAVAADRKVSFAADPFTLGVASGDPDATSVVFWTKLAPKPLEPDCGMKPEMVPVAWEVAEDEELRVDDRKADTPVAATEFVGTSISSGGNGPKEVAGLDKLLAANPCVKFHNQQRGYVRCTVTPDGWKSDYVVVEDVTRPGGKVLTQASFVVEAGVAGVKKA